MGINNLTSFIDNDKKNYQKSCKNYFDNQMELKEYVIDQYDTHIWITILF